MKEMKSQLEQMGCSDHMENDQPTKMEEDDTAITELKDREYLRNISLEHLNIPTSVTRIGNECFYGCISLKELKIPETVKEIGKDVFVGCESMTSIDLPSEWTYISGRAFSSSQCILKSLEMPSSLKS